MRRLLLIIIILALASSCFGQGILTPIMFKHPSGQPAITGLTLVGGCAATSTSCTPAATGGYSFQAGDYQYTFAFRTATTAPTKPAALTALDTASASTSSFRSGCFVLTSSTPDSSVWTNATRVMSLIYRGSAATATANCVTSGVGFHTSAGTSGTTSTYTFTGGTLTNTDSTSVVIGAVGSSAATCVPAANPSTITSRYTTTNGIIGDAELVSSFSTSTCTGTTGNWKSDVVELLAQQAATPTFSPASGAPPQSVTISSTTTGSGPKIYYTTDGSTPTSGSTNSTSVSVSVDPTTVKAKVIGLTAYRDSAVGTATYASGSPVTHVAGGLTGQASSTSGTGSFTYTGTANATNDAYVVAVSCSGTGTATAVSLTASGWSFTQIGSVRFDGFGYSAAFAAIAPNTSSTTFTATFTGMSACGSFTAHWGDEFSTNDITGGATSFYSLNSNAVSSGGTGCTGAAVTSTNANDMVWALCIDSLPTTSWAGAGWTGGVNDLNGDATEYQNATGSVTPAWTGSSGNFANFTAVIKAQ